MTRRALAILPAKLEKRLALRLLCAGRMEPLDIERIATLVVRDYGLPFRINSISPESEGKRIVAFSDPFCATPLAEVAVWCDAKATPYSVRETLKRALEVTD